MISSNRYLHTALLIPLPPHEDETATLNAPDFLEGDPETDNYLFNTAFMPISPMHSRPSSPFEEEETKHAPGPTDDQLSSLSYRSVNPPISALASEGTPFSFFSWLFPSPTKASEPEVKRTPIEILISAINNNDYSLVDICLTQNPDLLNYTDDKNENLVHIAARPHDQISSDQPLSADLLSYNKMLDVLSNHIKHNNKLDLLVTPDSMGSTPLHYAAWGGEPTFLWMYTHLSPQQLCTAVKTMNNAGVNPLMYAAKHPNAIMLAILEPYAFMNDCFPDPLIPDEKEEKDQTTYLALSKKLIAHMNTIVKDSATHPRNNSLDPAEVAVQFKRIQALRAETKLASEQIKATIADPTEQLKSCLKAIYLLCVKFGIANCGEYPAAALHYLTTIAPMPLRAEIGHIENGDHSFLVLGRAENSIPNDYRTWGNCYICDCQSKRTYTSDNIPGELKYFYWHKTRTGVERSIMGPFNPQYHVVGIKWSLNISAVPSPNTFTLPLPKEKNDTSRPSAHGVFASPTATAPTSHAASSTSTFSGLR